MKPSVKLCIVGGGSDYVPETVVGLVEQAKTGGVPFTTVCLYDVDLPRVELVAGFCRRILHRLGSDLEITTSCELNEAVKGSRFVITTMRVGGMRARISDEHLGRRFDIIGQETVGIGGFAKARRTIPAILKVAAAMKEFAPGAMLLNYTNPAGIVTEAVLKHGGVPVIGLCSIPNDYRQQAALALGCTLEEIELDYYGLNHLSFIRDVRVGGVSRWHRALAYMREHTVAEEWGDVHGLAPVMRGHIDRLDVMITYYLKYYLEPEVMLQAQRNSPQTRGEYIYEVLAPKLAKAFADETLNELPPEAKERGGSGYSRAAFALMRAIYFDTGETQIVCCRNNGALYWLNKDACVEVPARITATGAEAIKQEGPFSVEAQLLIERIKRYEQLTVESAFPRNDEAALEALRTNPLTNCRDLEQLLLAANEKDAQYLS